MAYTELVPATADASARVARPEAGASLQQNGLALAVVLMVAIVTRGLWIGDALVGGDEQFYLLVGDRLWQGALPYVDIWDRKPIGLFLIYAALRPFSSDGIVAYQVGALVFATLTAFTIARIASRLVPLAVGTTAGGLYLVWLPVLGGVGGQSPVFYNLFMVVAALLIIKAGESADPTASRRLAVAAMLLVGLAIQVKYTAVVEGLAFGLWLLHGRWQRQRGVSDFVGHATILAGAALLPTAMAAAFYVLAGHATVFFFTNFLSIFLKHSPSSETPNIAHNAVLVGPLLIFASAAFVIAIWRKSVSPLLVFLGIWTVAAICGFFVVGHYYTHYALPMLVPLCTVCALLLDSWGGLVAMVGCAIVFYAGTTGFPSTDRMQADHRKTALMVETLAPYARYGCIYLNEGPTILYLLTHSCLPTRYVFPEHLTLAAEAAALDTTQAMADILAHQPPAIVVRRWTEADLRNVATDRMLARALAANYHLKATIAAPKPRDVLDIFGRNDLP